MLLLQNNHGIDNVDDDVFDAHNFTRFRHYLEGSAGGNRSQTTAASIVKDIERFFRTVTSKQSKFYQQHICLNLLEKYYHF